MNICLSMYVLAYLYMLYMSKQINLLIPFVCPHWCYQNVKRIIMLISNISLVVHLTTFNICNILINSHQQSWHYQWSNRFSCAVCGKQQWGYAVSKSFECNVLLEPAWHCQLWDHQLHSKMERKCYWFSYYQSLWVDGCFNVFESIRVIWLYYHSCYHQGWRE